MTYLKLMELMASSNNLASTKTFLFSCWLCLRLPRALQRSKFALSLEVVGRVSRREERIRFLCLKSLF